MVHYLVLLCDANDPAGGPGAGIAGGLAELVAALAEVVLKGNNSMSDILITGYIKLKVKLK